MHCSVVRTFWLILISLMLTGCFVTSKKPLFNSGVDIGIESKNYALENTFEGVGPFAVWFVNQQKNRHDYFEYSTKIQSDASGEPGENFAGKLLYQRLTGYPGHYLVQDHSNFGYQYYLIKKDEDQLHISFMKLNKKARAKAQKAGVVFVDGSNGIKVETAQQAMEYAGYWIEQKGHDWYQRITPQNPYDDGDGVGKQFALRIIEDEQSIKDLKRIWRDRFCLAGAGHPDAPMVQALPSPANRGILMPSIKVEEAQAFCQREHLEQSPHAVQYALARIYQRKKQYLPVAGSPGSIAVAERLAKEGYSLGYVMLADSYVNGHGVGKDPQKGRQLLEQADQNDPIIQTTLGLYYLYGLFDKRDYKKALDYFNKAVDQNSTSAMVRLGQMYQYGWGIKKDANRAFELFTESSASGNPLAWHELGNAYYYGKGVKKNHLRSFSNYEKAGKAGWPASMYSLGFMQLNGQGTEKNRYQALGWLKKGAEQDNTSARDLYAKTYYQDPSKASKSDTYQRWLEQGAEEGNPELQYLLGWLYESGKDQPDDKLAKARYWYHLAAEQDEVNAQLALGRILLKKRHLKRAVVYYQKAVDQGNGRAAWQMGQLYFDGKKGIMGGAIKPDLRKATEYYEIAAKNGIQEGLLRLGIAYLKGKKVSQNKNKAVSYITRAAKAGNLAAQHRLGAMYSYGDGVQKDYKQAHNWFQKAADQGDAAAQFSLGTLYDSGFGVKQDYAAAIGWYNKASAQSYAMAWNNLGRLVEKGRGTKQDRKKAIELYEFAAGKNIPQAHSNLARIRATDAVYSHADKALKHAHTAIKYKDNAYNRELLAAAYAAKGMFNDAVAEQATAIAKAARVGRSYGTQDIRLKKYRQKKRLFCSNGSPAAAGTGCF